MCRTTATKGRMPKPKKPISVIATALEQQHRITQAMADALKKRRAAAAGAASAEPKKLARRRNP
jgi:hypothetical protein